MRKGIVILAVIFSLEKNVFASSLFSLDYCKWIINYMSGYKSARDTLLDEAFPFIGKRMQRFYQPLASKQIALEVSPLPLQTGLQVYPADNASYLRQAIHIDGKEYSLDLPSTLINDAPRWPIVLRIGQKSKRLKNLSAEVLISKLYRHLPLSLKQQAGLPVELLIARIAQALHTRAQSFDADYIVPWSSAGIAYQIGIRSYQKSLYSFDLQGHDLTLKTVRTFRPIEFDVESGVVNTDDDETIWEGVSVSRFMKVNLATGEMSQETLEFAAVDLAHDRIYPWVLYESGGDSQRRTAEEI